MTPWNKVTQGLPIKDRKIVFRRESGTEYIGRYDGLVFRPDSGEWFWHPSEMSEWRYVYE